MTGYDPYNSRDSQRKAGDVIEFVTAPDQDSEGVTVTEHTLPEVVWFDGLR